MGQIRIASVQINSTVGALADNAALIAAGVSRAADGGANVIALPELALAGYPPEDLVLKDHFLEDCEEALHSLAAQLPPDRLVVIGYPARFNHGASNAAAICLGGKVIATYNKMLLPNYGVFDEQRVFLEGEKALVVQIDDTRLAIHICEDSWFTGSPSCQLLAEANIDVLINLSASPYHRGKVDIRQQVLKKTAVFLKSYVVYCNLVGGQDEVVFDGASMMLAPDGQLMARGREFEEDILFTDLTAGEDLTAEGAEVRRSAFAKKLRRDRGKTDPTSLGASASAQGYGGQVEGQDIDVVRIGKEELHWPEGEKHPPSQGLPPSSENSGVTGRRDRESLRIERLLRDPSDVYEALKLGLKDYVDKNGFEKVLVAISGGIDSAMVAMIATDALGADRVVGVTMPSQYSSLETLTDAEQLANNLGIPLHTLPIRDLYDQMISELSPVWAGKEADVTEENIQARIRGNIIMALSNKFGWLVLATGNKSEMATGYCTLYGDMVGGFAVLKDVPKTLVFELSRWRNEQADQPLIPVSTIERPPSAELRPDQKDTDSLPDYDVLDPILERYVELDMGLDAIVADGFDEETVRRVIRLVERSEYKRRQVAPGIKITPKAFGRDRRMPITNLYGSHKLEALNSKH